MIPLSAGKEIVAIPGPSVVPDRVLAAMHRPMPDIYDGELLAVTDEVFDALPALAGTSQRALVTIGNGHSAWEMALTNTLSKGDRVLVLDCGRFAAIWGEMASFLGLDVELVESEPGFANDPGALEERLRADSEHQIKAVLTAHVDTASSAKNDIAAFREALDAAAHPALLMVDCIASMGCEPFRMDEWGVDLALSASQKGLMTPPGLGIVWPGERARAVHPTAGLRTRYWDWTYRTEDGPHYLRFCGTPPVTHLFGIREALRMIDEEGLDVRWERHRVLGESVRAAVEAWSTPDGIGCYVRGRVRPLERRDDGPLWRHRCRRAVARLQRRARGHPRRGHRRAVRLVVPAPPHGAREPADGARRPRNRRGCARLDGSTVAAVGCRRGRRGDRRGLSRRPV